MVNLDAIATSPLIDRAVYDPANVVNGWTRLKENPASLWVSDPSADFPQWLELDFGKAAEFNTVHLTFDTDLNTAHTGPAYPQTCVKEYTPTGLLNVNTEEAYQVSCSLCFLCSLWLVANLQKNCQKRNKALMVLPVFTYTSPVRAPGQRRSGRFRSPRYWGWNGRSGGDNRFSA